MCGFVGATRSEEVSDDILNRMTEALVHRGPDGGGTFRDERVVLGHRRLSVLDPTDRGAQPMTLSNNAPVIVYNGEIYNHLDLRKKLNGADWRSTCDTETMLRLYDRFGAGFVRLLNGMFSFCLYDRRRGKLLLYRDRMGEKPLYYFFDGRRLAFASELKGLLPHPAMRRDMDMAALRDYLLFAYIPAPLSIYRGVKKLRPGRMIEFDLDSLQLTERSYWSPTRELGKRESTDRTAAREELEWLVQDSVGKRLLSDVPVGCFLSGGTDSSLIAAAMARSARRKVQTFTIGFDVDGYDESAHARCVAKAIGSEHHEQRIQPKDLLAMVNDLPAICDEPFADASIIPTALLSRWTRQHVTVALSGDGGDELFLGYDRYRWAQRVYTFTRGLPTSIRIAAATTAELVPHYKTQIIARGMQFRGIDTLYPFVFIGWNSEFVQNILGRGFDLNRHPIVRLGKRGMSIQEKGSLTDLQHYLPDDILVKMDRAGMAASLETRAPFLDHRLVEFALRLPLEWRMNGGRQKILLKEVLFKHLPKQLFRRPKAGFAVPLKRWFRRELRGEMESVLSKKAMKRHGLFHDEYVRLLIKKHLSGRYNYERQLWTLFMFQLWFEKYMR